MVEVDVLFFALYRELAGTARMRMTLPSGCVVSDVVTQLRAGDGGLASLPSEPVVAVNREYVPLSTPLASGDEVAFIPPVSGG